MHPLELWWARATSWIYRGDKYLCNLCGFGARRLRRRGHNHPVIVSKQISGAGRRRVDCPKCLSSDRDRLIWEYLKTVLPTPNNQISILHVAPETPLSNKLQELQHQKSITYQAIDLKTSGYHYPKWVQDADLTDLPFNNNHFDFIIASHVLEHIPNLQKAILEIHRTLKPGGQAIVMFPVSRCQATDDYYQTSDFLENAKPKPSPTRQEKIDRFGQHDHIRLFGTDVIEILSETNLLEVFALAWNNQTDSFDSIDIEKRPQTDVIFILKKG